MKSDLYKLYFKKRDVKSYYIACELAKKAMDHRIIQNFHTDVESVNHEVIYTRQQKYELAQMLELIGHDNTNEGIIGYDIYGADIKYVHRICSEGEEPKGRRKFIIKDNVNIGHFCGWQIKLEVNERESKKAKEAIYFLTNKDAFEENELAVLMSQRMFDIQREFDIVIEDVRRWKDEKFGLSNKDTLFPLENYNNEDMVRAKHQQALDYNSFFKEKSREEQDQIIKERREAYRNIKKRFKDSFDEIYKQLILEERFPLKWKSEGELFKLVARHFPDAMYQYYPDWLSPQSLDVYVPSLKVGFEFQGLQHYEPVSFFGGEEALRRRKELDEQKREICKINKVTMIEWGYNEPITDQLLLKKLNDIGIENIKNNSFITRQEIVNIVPVVGITLEERKPFVQQLKINDSVFFQREPDNSYDPNALKALDTNGNMLGYVGKDLASVYAPLIDDGAVLNGILYKKELRVLQVAVKQI